MAGATAKQQCPAQETVRLYRALTADAQMKRVSSPSDALHDRIPVIPMIRTATEYPKFTYSKKALSNSRPPIPISSPETTTEACVNAEQLASSDRTKHVKEPEQRPQLSKQRSAKIAATATTQSAKRGELSLVSNYDDVIRFDDSSESDGDPVEDDLEVGRVTIDEPDTRPRKPLSVLQKNVLLKTKLPRSRTLRPSKYGFKSLDPQSATNLEVKTSLCDGFEGNELRIRKRPRRVQVGHAGHCKIITNAPTSALELTSSLSVPPFAYEAKGSTDPTRVNQESCIGESTPGRSDNSSASTTQHRAASHLETGTHSQLLSESYSQLTDGHKATRISNDRRRTRSKSMVMSQLASLTAPSRAWSSDDSDEEALDGNVTEEECESEIVDVHEDSATDDQVTSGEEWSQSQQQSLCMLQTPRSPSGATRPGQTAYIQRDGHINEAEEGLVQESSIPCRAPVDLVKHPSVSVGVVTQPLRHQPKLAPFYNMEQHEEMLLRSDPHSCRSTLTQAPSTTASPRGSSSSILRSVVQQDAVEGGSTSISVTAFNKLVSIPLHPPFRTQR